jgi:hypothetical protein
LLEIFLLLCFYELEKIALKAVAYSSGFEAFWANSRHCPNSLPAIPSGIVAIIDLIVLFVKRSWTWAPEGYFIPSRLTAALTEFPAIDVHLCAPLHLVIVNYILAKCCYIYFGRLVEFL